MDAHKLKNSLYARYLRFGQRLNWLTSNAGPALMNGKATAKEAAARLDRWFLVTENEFARPEQESLPVELNFEFIRNVSKVDALLYARGYAAKRHNSQLSWYGVIPFNDGFLVELHDGGSGHAYGPALIDMFETNARGASMSAGELPMFSAVLATAGARSVMVELSAAGVVTLVMPEQHEVPVVEVPRGARLTQLRNDAGLRALRVSMVATALSLGILGLVLLFSPGAHHVALVEPNISAESPLQALNLPVPPNQRRVALNFVGGKWEAKLEPKEAATMPTLRGAVSGDGTKQRPASRATAPGAATGKPAVAAATPAGKLAGAPASVLGDTNE